MKFKNTNDAIRLFEENAEKHGVATLNGDYKEANKCYKKIQLAKNFLLTQNDLNSLECLLHKESISKEIIGRFSSCSTTSIAAFAAVPLTKKPLVHAAN